MTSCLSARGSGVPFRGWSVAIVYSGKLALQQLALRHLFASQNSASESVTTFTEAASGVVNNAVLEPLSISQKHSEPMRITDDQ